MLELWDNIRKVRGERKGCGDKTFLFPFDRAIVTLLITSI